MKENDIVNMGLAKMVDAPVLLVGDIDRGGVFAQLLGTLLLLEEDEKERVKGLIINKFRGDKTILDPGIEMLEEKGNVPVIGVTPYLHVEIEDEDSLTERFTSKKSGGLLDIAVIRTPRISNFTDFMALENIPEVSLRYVKNVSEFGTPDMIILPGTKNTMGDLKWIRESGLEACILKASASGTPVWGICGGYQMLGEVLCDPDQVEDGGTMQGMGLLPSETVFTGQKTRTRVNGTFAHVEGIFSELSNVAFEGYEIHMGKSEFSVPYMTKLSNGKQDGISQGDVYGSYVHGIFDKCADKIVKCLCDKKGIDSTKIKSIDMAEMKEREYDRLADTVRESLDMDLIYKIINKEV